MRDLAIKVENISKAYRIGLKEQRHDTLGATLAAWVKSPFKNFKKLQSLSNFNNQDNADIFWALKDISFEVRKGEVLGIIGRNGAGKSTLLKILSRITEPTSGRAEIYGRVASLLEVGTGFNSELTGRENVYLNGTILGMTKKEIDLKFDEIIDFSGIEKFIDTPVKRYSSGMKVRLAFAVAAHLDPEILIIDEVLAVGDAEFQRKCLGKMQRLSDQNGRTVLFVSHDMTAIMSLTNNTIVLNSGNCSNILPTKIAIDQYLKLESQVKKDFIQRKNGRDLYIENILLNNFNNLNVQIVAGSQLVLKFKLNKSISDEDAKSVSLYVVFKNELNFPVFTISNRFDNNYTIENNTNLSYLVCELPSFCLAEGRYKGSTWLSYRNGFCDEIPDAFEVDIISFDFYETGQMPISRKHGAYLIRQNWKAMK